jgi:hypothetical protein
MAIRIVVTTWPRPRSLSTPNTDIGATGWMTITPYRIKSHSVSDRRSRGALEAVVVGLAAIVLLETTQKVETPSPGQQWGSEGGPLHWHGAKRKYS